MKQPCSPTCSPIRPPAADDDTGPRVRVTARRRLLTDAGLRPEIRPSSVDETTVLDTARADGIYEPADLAELLARAKARAVAETLAPPSTRALVLGCDSMLELDGELFGKPGTPEVAIERWRRMRGRSAVLHTGHWLVDLTPTPPTPSTPPEAGAADAPPLAADSSQEAGAAESTVVRFADVPDDEIAAYVATGEPLAVAGGFTLDGLGAAFVTRIDGNPGNVIGVSIPLLHRLVTDRGVPWFDLVHTR
ncbi:MAG: nucleoside triphosphate pyrophosphatase [Microthrixaceae bacterium]